MSSCLVLTPENTNTLMVEHSDIVDLLTGLQLIGNTIFPDNNQCFLVGDKYLNLVSFIGCAPTFEFSAPANIKQSDLDSTHKQFYYIRIITKSNITKFMHSDFSVKARCPHCRESVLNWKNIIIKWRELNIIEFVCSNCHKKYNIEEIEWGKTANFVNTSIELYGIQAELAIPSDKLLNSLSDFTKTKWKYFFG